MVKDFIECLKASALHQLYLPLLPFTHDRSESINADSLKLQLLTARKKGWWPDTADSLPQAVTCQLPIVGPTRYQLCYRDHQHRARSNNIHTLHCAQRKNNNLHVIDLSNILAR